VPRSPQTPMVRVHGISIFGDLRVRSLAPGESGSAWRRVLDRWRTPSPAQRPPPHQTPPGLPKSSD
jgi:hypothetical protein